MGDTSVLASLVFRFGRIYLRACENDIKQAAVLYALSCHGKPDAWLPIFATTMPFLESFELLIDEMSVRQIHIALTGLRGKSLIHQAHYIEKSHAGDPGTVVTDEGVDIETLPSSTRLIISRYPLPTYFVQVNYEEILQRAHPDIAVTVAAVVEKVRSVSTLRTSTTPDAKMLSIAFGEVYSILTKWGEEPFYIPSPLQTIITTMLERQIATL